MHFYLVLNHKAVLIIYPNVGLIFDALGKFSFIISEISYEKCRDCVSLGYEQGLSYELSML